MTDRRKDSKWLQQQAIELLEFARGQSDPDVASCTKLIDLLWKMLPKAAELDPEESELERMRQEIIDGTPANGG